jgi:stage V sporulation protein G
VEITEVRIKLMEEPGERLQAFCSITFDDCFVIRDLKIIEGTNGPFVAMPSRKLTSHCPQCGSKNHLRANFCNDCGMKLNANRAPLDEDGRAKLYADIAHPINSHCREAIQERVIREFREEQVRAKQPGYVSRYDDFDIDDFPAARGNRGGGRSHPTTNYNRPGSEPASRAQHAETGPRGPHRAATHHASPRRPASDASSNNGDEGSSSKFDEFGAGIF